MLIEMAQISKYLIPKAVYERVLEVFFETLINLTNKEETESFINDFLTPTEKIVLAKRIAAALLLEKEYQYRDIIYLLKVSFSTVARVNTMRKYAGGGYKRILKKLLKEEKIEKFFLNVGKMIVSTPLPSGQGSGLWKSLNQKIENRERKIDQL